MAIASRSRSDAASIRNHIFACKELQQLRRKVIIPIFYYAHCYANEVQHDTDIWLGT